VKTTIVLACLLLTGCGTAYAAPGGVHGKPTTPAPTTTPPPTTEPPPTEPPATDRTLLFADEFDGPAGSPPSSAYWRMSAYDESGRLNSWTRDPDVAYHDGQGVLVLQAIKRTSPTGRAYVAPRLVNQDLNPAKRPADGQPFYRLYGRWEVRALVPGAQGIWPAPLWTMGNYEATPGHWPECGEVDVIETINAADRAYGHLHMARPDGSDYGPGVSIAGSLSGIWHTYAVEWSPGQVEWFLDDVSYGVITRTQAEAAGAVWPFDTIPQSPIIDLAVGGWAGTPDPAWTTQAMLVDWVRVYQ
jgi:hypothetical protein